MPTLSELLEQTRTGSADLSKIDHATLYWLRQKAAQDQKMQDMIAPYEHRAYAREAVGENPLMALPIAAATPLYQLAKMAGISPGRSNPSLAQMLGGFHGIGEGLHNAMRRWR